MYCTRRVVLLDNGGMFVKKSGWNFGPSPKSKHLLHMCSLSRHWKLELGLVFLHLSDGKCISTRHFLNVPPLWCPLFTTLSYEEEEEEETRQMLAKATVLSACE